MCISGRSPFWIAAIIMALQAAATAQVASQPQGGVVTSQPTPSSRPAATSGPATQSASSQGLVLRVDHPKFDFGTLWDTDTVEHTFEMVNTGDRPVKILEVQATCGCTKPKDYARVVEPGEAWKLPISFQPEGEPGKKVKLITVKTDAPGQPQVVFELACVSRSLLEIKPGRAIVLGSQLERDSVVRKTCTITNQGKDPVVLKNPKVNTTQLKVDLREIEPGRKYELDVATVPPLKVARIMNKVTIQTDVKGLPELALLAIGQVRQRVTLMPETLMVPQPLDKELRRKLVVKGQEGVAFRVKGVSISSPEIKADVETVREGAEYNVWLTLPAGLSMGTKSETVTVATDDPEIPNLMSILQPTTSPMARKMLAPDTQPGPPRFPGTIGRGAPFHAPLRLPEPASSQPGS